MDRPILKQKIFLIISGILFSILLVEGGLRLGGYIYLKYQESRNTRSIRQNGEYRILCLGESTTASGGRDSYPSQLETVLNSGSPGIRFSVINKGKPGTKTADILANLPGYLDDYSPNMVITMMGINDIGNIIPYSEDSDNPFTGFLKSSRFRKLIVMLSSHLKARFRKIPELVDSRTLRISEEDDRIVSDTPDTDEFTGHIKLGDSYYKKKDYDTARKYYEKSLKIDPGDYMINIKLGLANGYAGRYEDVERYFLKARDINPKKIDAYIGLGRYYIYKKMYQQAESVYHEALKYNPMSERLYGIIAILYKKQAKHDLAETYFGKANAIRSHTFNPVTRDNYSKLVNIVLERGITQVAMQYPVRSIIPLKKMLGNNTGIIYVDNEKVFKDSISHGNYDEYFTDKFGGDFGHCTARGNMLIAANIANTVLEDIIRDYRD